MNKHSLDFSNIESDAIQIGPWTFLAHEFQLQKEDEIVKLEPRVAQLLSCLAANAGQTVRRETLMEEVWPGMIVGDEALSNAVKKLRNAFNDDFQNPRIIDTIPKAGYRLIAEVKQLNPVQGPDNNELNSHLGQNDRRNWLAFGAITITLLILSLWFLVGTEKQELFPSSRPVDPAVKPSIVVLPFDNLGQDPDQEYFTDGVTDDIITLLAKNPELVVIARESSFFYKKTTRDIHSIAKKLNVANILNGSIRRIDNQLVINAQLVNAASGTHIWAEQYLLPANNILQIEDNIAHRITASLLNRNPDDHSHSPISVPDKRVLAHDYLQLGRYRFYQFASKAEIDNAQKLFRGAIELDPEYALAYALLGWSYDFEAINGWVDDRLSSLLKGEQMATRAIKLQPDLALSYFVRGLSYREQGKYTEALEEAQRLLEYNPNDANGLVLYATLLFHAGRPRLGLEWLREAIKINPHHPFNYQFHLGQAYFLLHQYQQALEAFQSGLDSNPGSEQLHIWMAATYALMGDIENASWQAEQVILSNPEFTVSRMEKSFPLNKPAELKKFTDGLHLAGLH